MVVVYTFEQANISVWPLSLQRMPLPSDKQLLHSDHVEKWLQGLAREFEAFPLLPQKCCFSDDFVGLFWMIGFEYLKVDYLKVRRITWPLLQRKPYLPTHQALVPLENTRPVFKRSTSSGGCGRNWARHTPYSRVTPLTHLRALRTPRWTDNDYFKIFEILQTIHSEITETYSVTSRLPSLKTLSLKLKSNNSPIPRDSCQASPIFRTSKSLGITVPASRYFFLDWPC